jgi:aspartate/methionine/tyrosine aminotransferase
VPIPAPTSPALRVPRSGIRTLMDLALRDPLALHLEIGEPDQGVAPHVLEAAAAAGRDGRTGYTSSVGLPALRAAVAERVSARSGRPTTPDEVVVTHGAMHGLAMTFQALLGPGDEVLLPDPAFPNWAMAVTAAGAVPGTYPTRPEHGFVPVPAEVEAAITPRTRALLVCSPDNPTGAVYPAAVLAELVDIARRHDLWLLSDECYEAITFGVPFVSPAAFDTDGRVVVLGSVSKTYAMTGWRIGWVATPDRDLIDVLGHLSEALVACPSTVGQVGALAALTGPQDPVAAAVASYRERRDAATGLLAARGVAFTQPDGAFYLLVDVEDGDTDAFAHRLLEHRHVAVAPGSTFGAQALGLVRVSLASARPTLLEGLSRLADEVVAARAARAGALVL